MFIWYKGIDSENEMNDLRETCAFPKLFRRRKERVKNWGSPGNAVT